MDGWMDGWMDGLVGDRERAFVPRVVCLFSDAFPWVRT